MKIPQLAFPGISQAGVTSREQRNTTGVIGSKMTSGVVYSYVRAPPISDMAERCDKRVCSEVSRLRHGRETAPTYGAADLGFCHDNTAMRRLAPHF